MEEFIKSVFGYGAQILSSFVSIGGVIGLGIFVKLLLNTVFNLIRKLFK